MLQRGKQSSASLMILPYTSVDRPEPPDDLTQRQAETFRKVVHAIPERHLTAATEILTAQLARHVSFARVLGEALDQCQDNRRRSPLLAAHMRETTAIMRLSGLLKLPQLPVARPLGGSRGDKPVTN
jgi:lipoate synthase